MTDLLGNDISYSVGGNGSDELFPPARFLMMLNIADIDSAMNMTGESVRSATIVVSTVPILVLYPFLQRYFVKGITIGSVKG